MADFFAMGGYAFHVWTCWGVSLILLGGMAVARQRKLKQIADIANRTETATAAEDMSA